MFEFERTITENDYIRFNEHHALTFKTGKRGLLIYRFAMPYVSICFIFVIWAISRDWELVITNAVGLGILSLICILFAKNFYLSSVRRNIKLLKKNGKLPYDSNNHISFDETSFTDADENISSTYKYAAIETVYVTPTDIYLYLNSTSAIIMPYSIFSSVDEINNFIAFLSTKVESSKFKS